METFQRTRFADNASQLGNMIDFATLKPALAESRLFTDDMLTDIEKVGPSNAAKNKELLRCLPKRGPNAYRKFLRSLLNAGQVDAARILDDRIPDDGVWLGQVTLSTNWPATRNKVYLMSSRPRGVALIVSNTVFDNDGNEQRFGGEVDESNLQRLFDCLGFQVDPHRNKSRQDILRVFADFQNDERHLKADACVVIILSHGTYSGFVTADNLLVRNDEVLEMFNNANCAHLRRKPKIFFFVHCRGDEPDYAVRCNFKRSVADSVPTINADTDEPSLPTFSDVRICYSTCPTFISLRCEVRGTWFISLFVEICSKRAHDTDLDTILRDVSNRLASVESIGGWKQAPEFAERGWRYPLYFNPGLYK